MGGHQRPSLADLSAFPAIAWPYRLGLEGTPDWFDNSEINNWVHAVQAHLPGNPLLIDQRLNARDVPALHTAAPHEAPIHTLQNTPYTNPQQH